MRNNQDVLVCIKDLSMMMQAISDQGFLERLDKEHCEKVIQNAISLIYSLACEQK